MAPSSPPTIMRAVSVVQRWRYDWAGGHVRGIDVFTVSGGKVTEKLAYVKG
jgi:hypothetical protein